MSRRNKYGAQVAHVNGIRFDSSKEARRYVELIILLKAREIRDLELQPRYDLGPDEAPYLIKSRGYPNGRRARYLADFRYYDIKKGRTVVEDVKGMDTQISRLKRAIVEAQYKIEVKIL